MPKSGTPEADTGVSGLNCHLARPTTMSATNGAMMSTEKRVDESAMTFTPSMFMRVKAAMMHQQMR